MQIILPKKTLTFHAYAFGDNTIQESLTVRPAAGIQVVPEWVRDSSTFKMALKGGDIAEVTGASVLNVMPAELPAPAGMQLN